MARVLIVDDDPDFLVVSRTVLQDAGYETREAANGSQALKMMRKEKPDLVLLDVMMSTTLEGVDVSKTMEADPDLQDVPIVMVSSIATTEYATEFPDDEAIPIHAWISKPIQPKVLLNVVKRFID
jgi:CheY-like chemotaxis protein